MAHQLVIIAIALLASALVRAACPTEFNVLDYGAIGDGVHNDTTAVRSMFAAITACGGGQALFPAGKTVLTGGFNVTSNTHVCVCGTLLGSDDSSSYVLAPPLPWYGSQPNAWQGLIQSWYATNVSLTGCGCGGIVNGSGAPWWQCRDGPAPPCNGHTRPHMIRFVHSTNIVVDSITLADSPNWTTHFANCSHVVATNVTVTAPATSHNTDGFDIDCSSDVLISNCSYSGGDDAISVKSGLDYDGRMFGRPSENVTIQDFVVGTSHGLSIGSEMSAGVRNVTFRNIVMNGTSTGPRVKSQRGRGGVIQDIFYENVAISNVGQAIVLTLDYTPGLPPTNASATPRFNNIQFHNVTVTGASTGYILDGLNDSIITNVSLSGVHMTGVQTYIETDAFTTGTCVDTTPSCPPLLPPMHG